MVAVEQIGYRLKLLSEAHLGRIERHLRIVLNRFFNAEGLGALNQVIHSYVLAGGKRIRPQLCVWTFQHTEANSVRSEIGEDALLNLACAWELFHAFLLAHDDIIDNSNTRRGQASLHRQLAAMDRNSASYGANLGIVAGDLLFSAATQLWHELDLPDDLYRQELKLYSRVATTTGFGQAIDICQSHAEMESLDEGLLLRGYHWKTAAYTFEGPMLSGAILARVDEGTLQAISRFALALGQAYQIQNDLLDLSFPTHEGSDLVRGKRTIALMRARSGMTAGQRAEFDRRLNELSHANGEAVELAEALRKELRGSGAVEQTRELIGEFLREAESAANDRVMPETLAHAFGGLMDSLHRQYFAHPAEPSL